MRIFLLITYIDPDIEIGATSFQSKHFNAFGKIEIAPKIQSGVITPTAVTGPNKITKIGTEIIAPPNPMQPWVSPLTNKIEAAIINFL